MGDVMGIQQSQIIKGKIHIKTHSVEGIIPNTANRNVAEVNENFDNSQTRI